jgi:hypothetical protein
MNSPRYGPAGLLVEYEDQRIMIDGGRGAEPGRNLQAWLVTDQQGELIREIRKLAVSRDLEPEIATYRCDKLLIEPHPVVHTSHPAYGYIIGVKGTKTVWAPEFFKFPAWAKSADLMFAEAAGWNRPIYFRGGVGGHACVVKVAREAKRRGIQRLVFAHIGRPTIRAIDAGNRPEFGEFGEDGTFTSFAKRRSLPKQRDGGNDCIDEVIETRESRTIRYERNLTDRKKCIGSIN